MGIRIALMLTRLARLGEEGHAIDFRSDKKREKPVIFYWVLGVSMAGDEIADEISELSDFADVVVITDGLDFEKAMELGVYAEALPIAQNTEIARVLDWKLYAQRRIWRLREFWRPDIEISQGNSIDDYLEALGGQKPRQSIRELEEFPEAYLDEQPG